ncbi:Rhodanese-like protein [Burkholderiales bacterium]|nr:Rhodanese-like protein [Burkholderiales bacterium]
MTIAERRLCFEEAVAYVQESGQCAFAAVPVFGDDGETAEGARVFIVERGAGGGIRIRFLAGPFFSAALAADEILAGDEIPDRVRLLQFLPSTCREEWCSDQIQVLIGKLMQAAQVLAPEMPDYLGMPARAAAPEVAFPISMIGRPGAPEKGR